MIQDNGGIITSANYFVFLGVCNLGDLNNMPDWCPREVCGECLLEGCSEFVLESYEDGVSVIVKESA